MTISTRTVIKFTLLMFFACWLTVGNCTVQATMLGPGSDLILANPPVALPLSTSSLEVHRIAVSLPAGSYSIDSFSFHNSTTAATPANLGTVTPFLAILTNPGVDDLDPARSYQTIWVGPTLSVSNVNDADKLNDPLNLIANPYTSGAQHFTLPTNAAVYAGIYTTGSGRVAFRGTFPETPAARVDHDSSFTAPTTAGQTVGGFSNVFNNRIYAFQIDVSSASTLPAIPGDFNADQKVDGSDFAIWQSNFGAMTGKSLATGDADGDGDTDGADFIIWQTHTTTSAATTTAVPEPATAILFSWLAALTCLRRRKLK